MDAGEGIKKNSRLRRSIAPFRIHSFELSGSRGVETNARSIQRSNVARNVDIQFPDAVWQVPLAGHASVTIVELSSQLREPFLPGRGATGSAWLLEK